MFISSSLYGDLACLVITLLVVFVGYWKWTYQYWKRRGVPYLQPQIPFGNMANTLKGKEHISVNIKKIYDSMKREGWKHGGFFLFDKPNYIAIDLEYVRNILTKDFQYFADRDMYVNENDPLQAHLLNLTGTKWRDMRMKLTPTFTSGKMKMMFNVMIECQNDLYKRMDQESAKQEPINIKEILACFTTNIIGSCAFGLDCKALEDEDSEFRDYGKKLFTFGKWLAFKGLFVLTFPKLSKYLNISMSRPHIVDFTMKLVDDTIDYREKNKYTRNDFMQMMIDMKNKPGDAGLTMDELASQCLVFFAAGFETSSTLMTFAMYELAKDQDVQDKLRDEIETVLENHDNKLTYDAIQDMKYLTQVLDETLRMHPPGALTSRLCIKDYKVPDQDVIIEKGTNVTISILGIHYDEEYYPNPTRFDPDRFNDENKNSRHHYAHLPFGEGPRNCIGLRFGLLQSKVGIVSLLRNYRFTVNKKTQQPLTYQPSNIVLAAEGEIWLDAEKI